MKIDRFKVKKIMAERKISTQSELAKMMGISKNQLSNILSDKYDPIKSNVRELAEFLNIKVEEILHSDPDQKSHE